MPESTCHSCDSSVADDARFCGHCGTSIADATIARPAEDPELARVRTALAARYRIESLLGRGGMGAVYRAYEPSLDRYVAIKLIPESAGSDQEFVERFRREARLAAKLRHPRIVSIFEVAEAGGIHYFAMDHVEGETLRSLVRRQGTLPAEETLRIMTAVCDAVAHAHRKGIIHRDLKPENIMIGSEGEIFVLDFGLARGLDDPSITASGTVMGTPLYMSPEQLNGAPADERSDVFALALILYYCLTGANLFEGSSISAIISKQLSIDIRDAIESDPRIPHELKEALISALQRPLDRRTDSVPSFASELQGQTEKSASPVSTIKHNPGEVDTVATAPEDQDTSDSEARRRDRLRSLLNR